MRNEIKVAAKKLVTKNPNSKAVANARSWWKTGNLYSNHDFDILNEINLELKDYAI